MAINVKVRTGVTPMTFRSHHLNRISAIAAKVKIRPVDNQSVIHTSSFWRYLLYGTTWVFLLYFEARVHSNRTQTPALTGQHLTIARSERHGYRAAATIGKS